MELKLFESKAECEKILVENEPRLVKAADKNVCVIRQGSQLIAFINERPHLGESLHKGTINFSNEMVCPLHAYRFNLQSGEEAAQRCASLKFIRVIDKEGGIYLQL